MNALCRPLSPLHVSTGDKAGGVAFALYLVYFSSVKGGLEELLEISSCYWWLSDWWSHDADGSTMGEELGFCGQKEEGFRPMFPFPLLPHELSLGFCFSPWASVPFWEEKDNKAFLLGWSGKWFRSGLSHHGHPTNAWCFGQCSLA